MLKSWNHSTTTRNYADSSYKTLEEVPWHQGLKKFKTWQKFSKSLKKIEKIIINWGLMERRGLELATVGGGGGGDATERSTVGMSSNSKNSPSLHKYVSKTVWAQTELKGSKST